MATTTTSTRRTKGSTETTGEHPLATAGQEATQDAGRLAERAADIGFDRADQGRQQVADSVERVAGSIRRVSDELRSDEPGVADAATTAAEQAERVARYLRDTDARQLVRSVEDVARRQPILFVGGAFLLGLAASRFLKAAGGDTGSDRYGSSGDARAAYAVGAGSGTWGPTSGAGIDPSGTASTSSTRRGSTGATTEGAY